MIAGVRPAIEITDPIINYKIMKIYEKLASAINDQINFELTSAYLYLSLSNFWKEKGRTGVANWFRIQSKEEIAHAEIFMNYVHDRDGIVRLAPIEQVKQEWSSLQEAFADTLAHEQTVTKRIYALYDVAEAEKDYATRQMLNWYIAEQVEEEASVQEILDNLTLVGEDGTGILQIDRELGARTYTAPQPK